MRESSNSKLWKGLCRAAIAIVATGIAAVPASAQSNNWTVDSDRSEARIAIEGNAGGSAQSITLGGAGVSGTLRLDRNDLKKSTLQYNIYSAGSRLAVVEPGGQMADAAPYTLLSFRSEKVSLAAGGNLQVSGILTVTRVECKAELTPNEAHGNPVYIARVVSQAAREESFVIAVPASRPRDARGDAKTELSTLLTINREDFPELVNAVLSTNWPAQAQDKNCEGPLTAGEDYAGYLCTGSAVTPRSITRTAASFGEDYPGEDGNSLEPGALVTLALRLQLAPEVAQLAAKNGQ